MCVPKPDSSSSMLQQKLMEEQMAKANAKLSNEKTADSTGEKKGTKRTVTSLRVPVKEKTDTGSTGMNTSDTTAGLNIPI